MYRTRSQGHRTLGRRGRRGDPVRPAIPAEVASPHSLGTEEQPDQTADDPGHGEGETRVPEEM